MRRGLFASQVLKGSGQSIWVPFSPRVDVEGPGWGPQWGLRLNIVLLFPR